MVRHLQGIPALKKPLYAEQAYGEEHVETAGVLTETGILYRASGRQQDPSAASARRIHEREHGANSPEAVRDLHNLAGSHEEAGDM